MQRFWNPEREVDWPLMYNCSSYNWTEMPQEQRESLFSGYTMFSLGVLQWFIYIPYMVSLWNLLEQCCFKYLFVMGFFDLIALINVGVVTGYLAMAGSCYCQHPALEYWNGAIATGVMMTVMWLKATVALERCAQRLFEPNAFKTNWGERMFEIGSWCWTIPAILFGLWVFFFASPFMYSGKLGFYSMNPHFGYYNMTNATEEMYNYTWYWWNGRLIAFGYPIVYVITGTIIGMRWSDQFDEIEDEEEARKAEELHPTGAPPVIYNPVPLTDDDMRQRSVFRCICWVSFFNWFFLMWSLVYFIDEHNQTPRSVAIYFFLFLQMHGSTPVIMLLGNRSVRNGAKVFLMGQLGISFSELSEATKKELCEKADLYDDEREEDVERLLAEGTITVGGRRLKRKSSNALSSRSSSIVRHVRTSKVAPSGEPIAPPDAQNFEGDNDNNVGDENGGGGEGGGGSSTSGATKTKPSLSKILKGKRGKKEEQEENNENGGGGEGEAVGRGNNNNNNDGVLLVAMEAPDRLQLNPPPGGKRQQQQQQQSKNESDGQQRPGTAKRVRTVSVQRPEPSPNMQNALDQINCIERDNNGGSRPVDSDDVGAEDDGGGTTQLSGIDSDYDNQNNSMVPTSSSSALQSTKSKSATTNLGRTTEHVEGGTNDDGHRQSVGTLPRYSSAGITGVDATQLYEQIAALNQNRNKENSTKGPTLKKHISFEVEAMNEKNKQMSASNKNGGGAEASTTTIGENGAKEENGEDIFCRSKEEEIRELREIRRRHEQVAAAAKLERTMSQQREREREQQQRRESVTLNKTVEGIEGGHDTGLQQKIPSSSLAALSTEDKQKQQQQQQQHGCLCDCECCVEQGPGGKGGGGDGCCGESGQCRKAGQNSGEGNNATSTKPGGNIKTTGSPNKQVNNGFTSKRGGNKRQSLDDPFGTRLISATHVSIEDSSDGK